VVVATYSYLLYLCAIQRVAPSSKSYFRSLVLQLHQQNEAGFKVPVPQDWEPTSVASEATQALFWRPQALFLRQQELLWRPQTQFWIPQTLFWNAQAQAQGRRPKAEGPHYTNKMKTGLRCPCRKTVRKPQALFWRPQAPFWRPQKLVWRPQTQFWSPQTLFWNAQAQAQGRRPKAEGPHYTNKMKTGLRYPCRKTVRKPQALFWRPQAPFWRQQELSWRQQTLFCIPQALFWNAHAQAQGQRQKAPTTPIK